MVNCKNLIHNQINVGDWEFSFEYICCNQINTDLKFISWKKNFKHKEKVEKDLEHKR